MKKGFAILLAVLLLCGITGGCKTRVENPAPADESGASVQNGPGRYVEREIRLPLPEEGNGQYIVGVFRDGESICAIGCTGVGNDETYQARYYRYSIAPGGTVTAAEEPWLNACAPQGGNDIRVIRDGGGTLYLSFSGYDEQWNQESHIFVSEDNGATGRELTGDIHSTFPAITSMGVLADGSIAAMNFYGGEFALLDGEGKLLEQPDLQASSLVNCAAGGTFVAAAAPGGKAVRLMNRTDGSYTDFEYRLNEQSGAALALTGDGSLYLADATGLYRHAPDGTLWECLVEGSTCALGMPNFYPGMLYVDAAGQHDTLYLPGDNSIYVYAYDAAAAAVPEEELTVFSLTANETVRQGVVAFSRENSNVKVTYKVAMDGETGGTAQDYIKALNTELLAGTGPDVLILDGLPLDSYIEKDVLTDLKEIVEGAEPVLTNICGAAETDGTLYAVPTGFTVPLAIGREGTERTFFSLETLAEAAKNAGETPLLSNCAFNYETLAYYLLQYYGGPLTSGEESSVTAFLNGAKTISEATGCTNELGNGWEAVRDMSPEELREFFLGWIAVPQMISCLNGKAQAIVTHPLGSVANAMEVCAAADELDGVITSVNRQFLPVGLVGINKAGKARETAAAFVRMLLSYDAQGGNHFAAQFPVNQKAFTEMLAHENDGMSSGFNLDDGREFTALWPSKARREQLSGILTTLNMPISQEAALTEMLLPEVTSYLSGERTQAEATDRILSLLSTYLSE